ncbi:hypothetical protein T08_910 [Trichinella sp. T8]|nr:hypothetical protein T08_910 [Trichinella sp. T8]
MSLINMVHRLLSEIFCVSRFGFKSFWMEKNYRKFAVDYGRFGVDKGLVVEWGTVKDSLADLCYYVNPDSSRKTCKYKHSSYREYIRWLYFNTPSEPTGSTFMRSI